KEMVSEARRRGVCFAVDLNHRFTPATRLTKEKITAGELGEVLFVNMNLWIANRRDEPEYFHLRALHSHSVDVMRHLAGDVVHVHNAGGMVSFNETFGTRLGRWLEQLSQGAAPDQIEGSGEEGLRALAVQEAAIRSHETGHIMDVAQVLEQA